jgi:hypothetical protein
MQFIARTCLIAALVALASPPLTAQQSGGTVTVKGQVSAIAAVSAGSVTRVVKGEAELSAEAVGAQMLVLSLSGTRGGQTEIEIPVQLRSNADFALTASCATRGTALSALHVVEVGGAGAFVYPGAAARVEVASMFDGRPGTRAPGSGRPELSTPVTILTGPPVSLRGTLNSPGNMIEVVLRVVLTAPNSGDGWHAELKVSATPRAGAE